MTIYFTSPFNKIYDDHVIIAYDGAKQARKIAGTLFVDSGIFKTDRTLKKILHGQKYGDIIAAPDVSGNVDKTVENTIEWYRYAEMTHEIDQMCFPLQGNTFDEYMDCYRRIAKEIKGIEYVGIGGLTPKGDVRVKELLPLVNKFQQELKIKVHLFGLGYKWLPYVAEYKPYSMDSSKAIMDALNCVIRNERLQCLQVAPSHGETQEIRSLLYQINVYQLRRYLDTFNHAAQTKLDFGIED